MTELVFYTLILHQTQLLVLAFAMSYDPENGILRRVFPRSRVLFVQNQEVTRSLKCFFAHEEYYLLTYSTK